MPTLRIPVSEDLHHRLIELKGKMKADDWPALMQCILNEARWADFAIPLINTLLEWTETDPVQEPEALRKLGFAVLDIDGKGSKAIMYPGLEVLICPETASLTCPETRRPMRPAGKIPDKCPKCGGHVEPVYHTGDKENDPTEWDFRACGRGGKIRR